MTDLIAGVEGSGKGQGQEKRPRRKLAEPKTSNKHAMSDAEDEEDGSGGEDLEGGGGEDGDSQRGYDT